MRLSIAIPARNGELHLRECLLSAISQSRPADEILVVDDASTDGTSAIARSASFSERIIYVHNPIATGFVDAWNRAAERATGDFVTILHQDDLVGPDYLEAVEQALKRYPSVKHLYSACHYIDAAGAVIRSPGCPSSDPVLYTGRQYAHNYLMGVVMNDHIHRCPGVTTSRELLLQRCRYRKEAGHIADDDFFLRVGAFTDVIGIGKPLASFRIHDDSVTGRVPLLSLQLAEGYLFQSRYQVANKTLLDGDDIEKIHQQTVRFINLVLCQALKQDRSDWLARAISLQAELEQLLPGFMGRTMPGWARVLWKLAGSSKNRHGARIYAHAIAGSVALRDGFKRAFRAT